MPDGFVCQGLLNTKIRTLFKEAIKCVHLGNDCYPGITHFNLCGCIYYTHISFTLCSLSFDAVFIKMKQQRLVMLYLSAIEQIKKIKVTTIIAFILDYETI